MSNTAKLLIGSTIIWLLIRSKERVSSSRIGQPSSFSEDATNLLANKFIPGFPLIKLSANALRILADKQCVYMSHSHIATIPGERR